MKSLFLKKTGKFLIFMIVVIGLIFTGCNQTEQKDEVATQTSKTISTKKQTSQVSESDNKDVTTSKTQKEKDITVDLRKFPYPYKAMIAIASDIDGCSAEEFEIIHRFLNTTEDTVMGKGVGLDIADSFFMYNVVPSDQMSYWEGGAGKTIPKDKDKIIKYIKAGWIDFLHSYGNFSIKGGFKRELAVKAIAELKKQGINNIEVYMDHGDANNHQNWCKYVDYMKGAIKGAAEYHADITVDYGIKFTWSKNTQKGVGNAIFPFKAKDGQTVWGFHRYTKNWDADKLHYQLTPWLLKELKSENQYIIIANHLGNVFDGKFVPQVVTLFRRLKHEQESGEILIARTSRLLRYNLAQLHTKWEFNNEKNRIVIHSIDDPLFGEYVPEIDDVRGLTFKSPDGFNKETQIYIKDKKIADISMPTEKTIMINWFKPDTTDYTTAR